MATLKELSQRTGYSPATISRILTKDPSLAVSEEARARVLEEAGHLNYAATKSRRGRTPKSLLRVAVAEMLTPAQQLDDPFYLYLRSYVEQACLDQRFALAHLGSWGEDFVPPEGGAVDGVVAVGRFTPTQVEALAKVSKNLVFLNSSPDESRFDSVVLNYDLGIRLALDHLLSLGHRHIGFLGPAWKLGDRRDPVREVRRARFVAMMEEHALFDPRFLVETAMDARSTSAALAEVLAQGRALPTAFIAASEETAMGAIRCLEGAGHSIPGDLSLVSFNDTPLSELVSPSLTSVSTHVEEMSRSAVRLLAERAALRGRPPVRTLPVKVVMPPSLTARGSTAPPKNLARPMPDNSGHS